MAPYAAMLMIGKGGSDPRDVQETVEWHQERQVWLSNEEHDLPTGTPVVARMGGPSNELLIDGLISGRWSASKFFADEWAYQVAVVWSRHSVREVRARDVLGQKGVARRAYVKLDQREWASVQSARMARL